MAKLSKSVVLNKMDNKIAELEARLQEVLNDGSVTDSTKRTQKFQRNTEIARMKVCRFFLESIPEDEIEVDDKMAVWIGSMVTLTSERLKRQQPVEVHAGDKTLDLLQKYKDVKDPWGKIKKACESAGLKIVYDHIE